MSRALFASIFMLLSFSYSTVSGQAGTEIFLMDACTNNTLPFAGMHNGKNYYYSSTAGIAIYWDMTNMIWKVDGGGSGIPGVDEYIIFSSSLNTDTNPPDLALGNWMPVNPDCVPLSQLDGTGTVGAVAPVTYSKFSVRLSSEHVTLEWTTESEVNNAGFVIERSLDGHTFDDVDFIEGIGNSTRSIDYQYEDKNVSLGTLYYYRLRQMDFDGRYAYSKVQHVEMSSVRTVITFGPNPASNNVTVSLQTQQSSHSTIELINYSGSIVRSEQLEVDSGTTTFSLDLQNLFRGVYILKITTGGDTFYEKLIVR